VSLGEDVVIIGAGPYGLSVAAHLRAQGVGFRILGHAMQSWCEGMPAGIHLKSDGFASNLYEPAGQFTLERYCAEHAIPYHPLRLPVALETFVAYGRAFQGAHVPMLEPQLVSALERDGEGFAVKLEDGSDLRAHQVVIATGISHLGYVPQVLERLPAALCTHSSAHHDLSGFRGKQLIVVGAGASATDIAILAQQAGASVELVARRRVHFHEGPGLRPRSLRQRIRRPHLGLGPGFRSALYTVFPGQFRWLPVERRLSIVRRHLGPAGGWFMRDLARTLVMHQRCTVESVEAHRDRVLLRLVDSDARRVELEADHVIAATGYRAALNRLAFLEPSLRDSIEVEEGYPALSSHFESSVRGLYFVGLLAAGSFGPLLRFALGARYTARNLAPYLRRSVS